MKPTFIAPSVASSLAPFVAGVALITLVAGAPRVEAAPLDTAAAQALVDRFYGALTASDLPSLEAGLVRATQPDWRNCGGNDQCQDRDATLQRWRGRIESIPDLRWTQRALVLAGDDTLVVRGEVSGTPRTSFLGLPATGSSFRVMTIDMHRVRDGRIVETYHVEDWAGAMRQISASRPDAAPGTTTR